MQNHNKKKQRLNHYDRNIDSLSINVNALPLPMHSETDNNIIESTDVVGIHELCSNSSSYALRALTNADTLVIDTGAVN